MPVRPWDPVAPVAPVAPAAPVAPVAPVAPFGSAISIQLASEHATSNPLLAEYARSPAFPALQGTLAQLSAVHSHSADVKVTYPTVPLFELVQLGRPVSRSQPRPRSNRTRPSAARGPAAGRHTRRRTSRSR